MNVQDAVPVHELPIDVSDMAELAEMVWPGPPLLGPPPKSRLVVSAAGRWVPIRYKPEDPSARAWRRRRRLAVAIGLGALVLGGALSALGPDGPRAAPTPAAARTSR